MCSVLCPAVKLQNALADFLTVGAFFLAPLASISSFPQYRIDILLEWNVRSKTVSHLCCLRCRNNSKAFNHLVACKPLRTNSLNFPAAADGGRCHRTMTPLIDDAQSVFV